MQTQFKTKAEAEQALLDCDKRAKAWRALAAARRADGRETTARDYERSAAHNEDEIARITALLHTLPE